MICTNCGRFFPQEQSSPEVWITDHPAIKDWCPMCVGGWILAHDPMEGYVLTLPKENCPKCNSHLFIDEKGERKCSYRECDFGKPVEPVQGTLWF